MVDWFNFTTFDIMADLTFGEPLELLEGSMYTPWVRALFSYMRVINLGSNVRCWPWLERLLYALASKKVLPRGSCTCSMRSIVWARGLHRKRIAQIFGRIFCGIARAKRMRRGDLHNRRCIVMLHYSCWLELRIYPPVAGPLSRVAPKGGVMVRGNFIPEGVGDQCSPYFRSIQD